MSMRKGFVMKRKCDCGASTFKATVVKTSCTTTIMKLVKDDEEEEDRYTVHYRDDADDLDVELVKIECANCGLALSDTEWDIDDDDINQGIFSIRFINE